MSLTLANFSDSLSLSDNLVHFAFYVELSATLIVSNSSSHSCHVVNMALKIGVSYLLGAVREV